MARFKVLLFGGLAVVGDGFELRHFPTKRAAAILARLALSRNASISRDELAELLWPDDFLDTTRVRLRAELTRLRAALGPAKELVTADKTWIRMDLSIADVDVAEFERAKSDPEKAVDLYRGTLLPEMNEPWVFGPRIDLQARFEELALSVARAKFNEGDSLRAREVARKVLEFNPLEKSFAAFLAADQSASNEGEAYTDDRPPTYPDLFIGRDREKAELRSIFAEPNGPRIVTLLGPGGSGKTRLAVEIGGHEIAFLSLESIAPEAFSARVADALARSSGDYVVIDNAEVDVDTVAMAISQSIRAFPRARFLITSRQRIGVRGERIVVVESLHDFEAVVDLDSARDSPCVSLFMDRVKAIQQDFQLDESNWADIAHLLSRLDGLPLAIELVASNVALLGLHELVRRFDDRIELRSMRRENVPERQRSLLAVVQTSIDSLDEKQRRALARLSVIVGPFQLELAEKLLDDPDPGELLEQLRDRSLLSRRHDRFAARYRMLDTIRVSASSLLDGEEKEVLRRKVATALRDEWSRSMQSRHTPREPEALARLQPDRDNLLASLEWAAQADPDLAASLIAESWWFFACLGGSADGMRLGPKILAGLSERTSTHTRSRLQFGLAHMANCHGDYEYARQGFSDAYETEGTTNSEFGAWCLLNQAAVAQEQGDYPAMKELCERAMGFFDGDSSEYIKGVAIAIRALSRALTGEVAAVISEMELSLAKRISLGYPHEICRGYVDLSCAAREVGDLQLARISGNRACDLVGQSITDLTDALWAFLYRASLAVEERDIESLRRCLDAARPRHRRIGGQRDYLELCILEGEYKLLERDLAEAREVALHTLSRAMEIGNTPAMIDAILFAAELHRENGSPVASNLAAAILTASELQFVRPSRRRRAERLQGIGEGPPGFSIEQVAAKALTSL